MKLRKSLRLVSSVLFLLALMLAGLALLLLLKQKDVAAVEAQSRERIYLYAILSISGAIVALTSTMLVAGGRSRMAPSRDRIQTGPDLRRLAEVTATTGDVFFSEGQRLSHTGSWAFIVATQQLIWSEEHCRLLGYDPATTTPSLELFWQRVHPEDLPWMQRDFAMALDQKQGVDREFRVILPDGTIKFLHGMDQAVVDEAGRLVEFVGTTMDISDRKQAEAALYEARAELARVTRTTTMGEFAASIAHEVSQPLAAVVTNANACDRWLAREVPEIQQARAATQRVIKDGKRAGDVIAGIRSLFKKSPMELGPVDLAQVIHEVLEAINPELRSQRIVLRKSIAADLPPILGDWVQLQQVMLNLITNAIQAMSGMTERPRDLAIGVTRSDLDGGPGVRVTVQDTGVGFEPDQESQLFEAFYTTKSDGLGMGLAINRSIIEALGGRLWASPSPAGGAMFHFVLPVSPDAVQQPDRKDAAGFRTVRS